MIGLDTNILIHAHRSDGEHHAVALDCVRQMAEGDAPWAIPVFCIGEFLRVVTHRRVFNPPSHHKTALAFILGVVESPQCRLAAPGARFLRLLEATISEAEARGNLVFDAQIVAVCRERGIDRLVTFDRDFDRFTAISTLRPGLH